MFGIFRSRSDIFSYTLSQYIIKKEIRNTARSKVINMVSFELV